MLFNDLFFGAVHSLGRLAIDLVPKLKKKNCFSQKLNILHTGTLPDIYKNKTGVNVKVLCVLNIRYSKTTVETRKIWIKDQQFFNFYAWGGEVMVFSFQSEFVCFT